MEKAAIFGEIESFSEKNYFEEHRYEWLFCNGKDHGLEFFVFLDVDAYDYYIYRPAVQGV